MFLLAGLVSVTLTTRSTLVPGNLYRVKVNPKVNPKDKTFAIEATFSAKKLKALPAAGEIIDVTYTPTPGGPMEATAVKGSKSNSSDRMATAPKRGGRYDNAGGRHGNVSLNTECVQIFSP